MRSSRRNFLLVATATALAAGAILTFAVPKDSPISAAKLIGPEPVHVTIASSVTKQRWIQDAIEGFAAQDIRTASGRPIDIAVSSVLSGESMLKIADGNLQPTVWSPGESAWVDQLADSWKRSHSRPIHSAPCQPTVLTPVGFAMWRPMAEALGWPGKPIGWKTLIDLANDGQGWARYGHPEWGALRLGHTHPQYSSAGLLFLASAIYATLGTTEGLTPDAIYAPEVTKALSILEADTAKYGMVTTDLLTGMAKGGPSFLHVVAGFEEGTVRFNIEHRDELRWPLAFVFPKEGTFWSDHPYCILDASGWVDAEQSEAANLFLDYLRSDVEQGKAETFYLRPLSPDVTLGAVLNAENGTDPAASPKSVSPLAMPTPEAATAIIDQFATTKRKATTLLVLDVSGSMNGERIRTATTATAEFIARFSPQDRIGLMLFNDHPEMMAEIRLKSDISESLQTTVSNLVAGGGTNLNGAVCRAADKMRAEAAKDAAAGDHRVYGIVLLSDGADTAGEVSDARMFSQCLKVDAEEEGFKIFAISLGTEAPADVLVRLAQDTHGAIFEATPDSIASTYLKISAEQ